MTDLKPGQQLASVVCETRVVVVRAGPHTGLLTCGGEPMVLADDAAGPTGTVVAGHEGPTLIGKRYVDADEAIEVLCIKPGIGRLARDGVPLEPKSAKPLPSSD